MPDPCWKCGAPPAFEIDLSSPASSESAPHFERLLRGNEPPHDSEIPFIRDTISDSQNQVDALDAQIHGLEAALAELVRRRDEATRRVVQYRSAIHPIRRMPPELICEIFSLTLPSEEEIPNNSPWHLGHICRSWRFAGLAYPQLWRSIAIPSSLSSNRDFSALQTQLLRSASASLTVSWVNKEYTVDPQVADLVLAQSDRWAILRLKDAYDALDWLLPAKGRLSSLRKLEMLGSPNGPDVELPDLFSTAPSLCEVVVTDWEFGHYSAHIQIPWSQITHYRGAYRERDQLAIFHAAPNLIQSAISFEVETDQIALFEHDPASIVLPHLRRLCLEMPGFITHLRCPSLEALHFLYVSSDDTSVLLSFVHRSRCVLQRLVLMSCEISAELIAVLRGLPNLKHLLIQSYGGNSEEIQSALFNAMVISGTSGDLCPNLTSFIYGVEKYFPRDPFLAMASSRFCPPHAGPRLKSLYLFYDRLADPAKCSTIPDPLLMLRMHGFDAGVIDDADRFTPEAFWFDSGLGGLY